MKGNGMWLGVALVIVLVLLFSNQRSMYDLFTVTNNQNGQRFVFGMKDGPGGTNSSLYMDAYPPVQKGPADGKQVSKYMPYGGY